MNEQRSVVKAAHPDFSIGSISKEIGRRWATLSEAEKAKYHEQNLAAKAVYAKELAAFEVNKAAFIASGGVTARSLAEQLSEFEPVLPLGRIKRIMKKDPDVNNVSSDGVFATAICVDHFVALLGEAACRNMASQKRKSMRYEDVAAAIRTMPAARFLEVDFPPHRKAGDHSAKRKLGGENAKLAVESGPINGYFKKAKPEPLN